MTKNQYAQSALRSIAAAQRQQATRGEALAYLDDPYELAARRGAVTAQQVA